MSVPGLKLFLSTVTAEFRSYRDVLRADLKGPLLEVKVQEDFIQTGGDTLSLLDAYIRECDAVIHLVGDATGTCPAPHTVQMLLQRYPDFAAQVPMIADLLPAAEFSYTQWEAYLALYHGKTLFIYQPSPEAPRDDNFTPDPTQKDAQLQHILRMQAIDRWAATFLNHERLSTKVLQSIFNQQWGDRLSGVESTAVKTAGITNRLLARLCPLECDDSDRYLARFTGRRWVIEAIDKWQSDAAGPRAFWIAGPPGIGKTALASWLRAHRSDVAAFHVCRFGYSEQLDPRRVVQSIAYQLAMHLPTYAAVLQDLPLEQLMSTSARYQFDSLLIRPLAQAVHLDHPVLVVIDGLDEANRDGRNELASLLGSEWVRTPPWLRLVLTSRPDPEVIFPLQSLTPVFLDTTDRRNEDDMREFLARELPLIVSGTGSVTATVEAVLQRSEGCFLYAEWVRRELAEGRLSLNRLEEFPQGLGGVYAQFFERQFSERNRYEERILPLLEILAAAREPLELTFMSLLLGWDDRQRDGVLRALGSLFSIRNGRLEPFHRSLIEWLSDPARAGPFLARPNEGHRRLTEAGWKQYQEGKSVGMAGYFLRHLPRHLMALNRLEDAVNLLLDWQYLETRAESGNVLELPIDLASVRYALPPENPRWALLARLEAALRVDLSFLLRHPSCLLQCVWNNGWWSDNTSVGQHDSEKIATWLDHWCRERDRENPRLWLRSLRSPASELGVVQMVLRGHEGALLGASTLAAGTGSLLVTAGEDGSWRLWDGDTGVERACQRVPGLTAFAFAPLVNIVVSGHLDGSIMMFEARSGKQIAHFRSQMGRINSLAVTADASHVVIGGIDGTARVWDIGGKKEIARIGEYHEIIERRSYTILPGAGDGFNITPTPNGGVRLSRQRQASEPAELIDSRAPVQLLDHHTGKILQEISCPPDKRIEGWIMGRTKIEVVYKVPRKRAPEESHAVFVAVSPEGKRVATGSGDGIVRLWNLESGKQISKFTGLRDWITCVAFSPDGQHVAAGSFDNTIGVWDIEHDSKRKATGLFSNPDDDCVIRVGADASGTCCRGHEDGVTCIVFSADSRRLASGADDATLRLWDVKSGVETNCLNGHEGGITNLAWLADGRLLSCGEDRTALVWRVPDRSDGHASEDHEGPISSLFFNVSGSYLTTRSATDETERKWEFPSGVCRMVYALGDREPPDTIELLPLPWEANVEQGATIIRDKKTGEVVAWYPSELTLVARHPNLPLWAGANANRLHLIRLEGASATDHKTHQLSTQPSASPVDPPRPVGLFAMLCRWLGLG